MYGDRDNQSCLIALPMKCFVYCLGFLIVVLASSNAFSSFEYRIRMIAPKLYPYLLPENAGSPVFECMVTDCSCYKVVPDDAAAFLKGAVPGSRVLSGKGFGVSDFSEFCSKYNLSIRLPWVNKSSSSIPFEHHYTARTWSEIGDRYSMDVDLWESINNF